MGIYDRDYGQSGGFGGGGFGAGGGGMGGGGFGGFDPNSARTANTNLLLGLAAVYVAQLVFSPTLGDLLSLPSDWLSRPWRAYGLVSYALLHAEDNIMHLLFNGLALFFFGRAIEPGVSTSRSASARLRLPDWCGPCPSWPRAAPIA